MNIEKIYVKDVYNKIAKPFNLTRYVLWNHITTFIQNIPDYSLIADIGCGNGKNMMLNKKCEFIGMDFTESFTKICSNRNLEVVTADTLQIPYRSNTFDYVISIAVIHHLSTPEKRLESIKELIRITKESGLVYILVWAFEQEADSKRKFTTQDELVSWITNDNNIYYRYYHLFIKDELFEICNGIENIIVKECFYEQGNWGIVLQKMK
jgi:ubiquinone/menaquinone biosynthesis C-methylase UbiE